MMSIHYLHPNKGTTPEKHGEQCKRNYSEISFFQEGMNL
jgi:hypothetical protein